MPTAGYSGKPLAEKLGLRADVKAAAVYAPDDYTSLVQLEIDQLSKVPSEPHAFLHAFYRDRAKLAREVEALRSALAPGGSLWISWPKKSAKVTTDLSEQDLRDLVLPLGLVDTKVCAVDETWSGLKFMYRKTKQ